MAPAPGDTTAIRISIMRVMGQMLTGEIYHKTASVLLCGLQNASINLRNLTTGPEGQAVTDGTSSELNQTGRTQFERALSSSRLRKYARSKSPFKRSLSHYFRTAIEREEASPCGGCRLR